MKEILPGFWQFDELGEMVNCYLLEWDQGVTLIDTGVPGNSDKLLAAIQARGYASHNIARIIVTHMDVDHVGNLLPVKKASRAPIACHTVEKTYLEHPGKRQPTSPLLRPLFWAVSKLPQFHVDPVSPDELWVDGQATPEGFTVIHTPGHTPGHISLLHKQKRLLISGDAINNRKEQLSLPPPMFTPDMHNAQRSIWKLAKKYGDDFDVMVFGHGPPIMQNGGKRVQAMASQIFSTEI
jgi:glyoxylase-like metal-dependent hydrolase (beta-lactamase superfamily II)